MVMLEVHLQPDKGDRLMDKHVKAHTHEDAFIDAAYMALQAGLPLERAIEILGEVAHWKEENWGVTH